MASICAENAGESQMLDRQGREIDYMRISLTDRCNLRCSYCMPNGIELMPMSEILTFEEIERICMAAARTGIRKLKITGGEPLVRLGCPELIGTLKKISGIEQVTLTTNGVLLAKYLPELMENGLDSVNISLDTLDRNRYMEITGKDELEHVLEGMDRAVEAGLAVKVNVVSQKEIIEEEWEQLVGLAKDRTIAVRFIELMPIGYGKHVDAISNEEVIARIRKKYTGVTEDHRVHGNGPAVYYRIPEYRGSVGLISAIHGKFCHTCNRIRLTSTGKLKPCLCYEDGVELKEILRGKNRQEIDSELQKAFERAINGKPEAHCFEHYENITENQQMVQIGG